MSLRLLDVHYFCNLMAACGMLVSENGPIFLIHSFKPMPYDRNRGGTLQVCVPRPWQSSRVTQRRFPPSSLPRLPVSTGQQSTSITLCSSNPHSVGASHAANVVDPPFCLKMRPIRVCGEVLSANPSQLPCNHQELLHAAQAYLGFLGNRTSIGCGLWLRMHARRVAAGDMAAVLPCVDESMTYMHRGALHFKATVDGHDRRAANQLV